MLVKIAGIQLKTKGVKYHHSCKREYLHKAQRVSQSDNQGDKSERTLSHNNAFQKVKQHIQTNFIDKQGVELLSTIHKLYIDVLNDSTYASPELLNKILNEYTTDLCFKKLSNKEGIFIYSSSISIESALRLIQDDEYNVKETALDLRSEVLSMLKKKSEVSLSMTVEDVKKDEVETPDKLIVFFCTLLTGSSKASDSKKTERLVKSLSDDVIYTTTRGHIKPSKHKCVGLGIKSLTGSRKVIDMLNHFGHCVNYHKVEEIETDPATKLQQSNSFTPDGMNKVPGLCMGLAWDNYDENIETLSGANTLHDTVGICYQNIDPESSFDNSDSSIHGQTSENPDTVKVKSKRSFVFNEK